MTHPALGGRTFHLFHPAKCFSYLCDAAVDVWREEQTSWITEHKHNFTTSESYDSAEASRIPLAVFLYDNKDTFAMNWCRKKRHKSSVKLLILKISDACLIFPHRTEDVLFLLSTEGGSFRLTAGRLMLFEMDWCSMCDQLAWSSLSAVHYSAVSFCFKASHVSSPDKSLSRASPSGK